jgi:glycosyltransferase involved in cell wall biosynthesis
MNASGKKFRVLMFSTYFPPQYSGAAKQGISLANQLRKRGYHIEFITVKWPGTEDYELFDGFPVHRIEAGRGAKHKEFRFWWNLLKFSMRKKHEFDIFHSHGAYYTNSIIGPLAKLAGWRSLIKASLADNDLHGLRKSVPGMIHYTFLRMIDLYVAISRDIEREFLLSDLPAGRVVYLPNGVDTERFHPVTGEEKTVLRRSLGLPEDCKIALTVGVFDERKNIGWLMEEWTKNSAFETKAYLCAIGPQSREDNDGKLLRSLKQLASEHREILCLRDYADDITRYYQAADFFILPSLSEGMPNVVLEAMASGLPCVSTRVSGVEELVKDGETGYLFGVKDGKGLYEAIRKTLQNLDGTMGRRARESVEDRYSLFALADQYEEVYRKLSKTSKDKVGTLYA